MTSHPVGVVFDTSAVLAYARGSVDVGEVLTEVVDGRKAAAVPVVCLAEAAPAAVEAERLDALVGHPAVVVIADEVDGWQALGHMCAVTGDVASASVALASVDFQAWILTARPDRYRDVAGGELVVPISD